MTAASRPLVVFDLDGTLVDSRRDLADSTNEMLATYGAPPLPADRVASMVGEGARLLVRRAVAAALAAPVDEDEALARFRAIYDRRLLLHTRLYDGIAGAIRACAARATLAVLTNKPEQPSRTIVEGLGIARFFEWVVGGDSPFGRKPDPAGLLALVERAGAGPGRALFVGDSRIDVATGQRAGVPVCAARYGFGLLDTEALAGAAWIIEAPGDLIEVLDRCFADH